MSGAIRAFVIDRIDGKTSGGIRKLAQAELPDEPVLRAAAQGVGLSQSWAAGLTLGHAVIVRRGFEREARLLSHEFRHVAQYESMGGIGPFLVSHLKSLVEHGYEDSPFERDARAHER